MSVIFAGPDDNDTCVGKGSCDEAVNGSPYDIDDDDIPVPGTLLCMGNCRHFLQLDGDFADSSAAGPGGRSKANWTGTAFAVAGELGSELAATPTDEDGEPTADPDSLDSEFFDSPDSQSDVMDELDGARDDREIADILNIHGMDIGDWIAFSDVTPEPEQIARVQAILDDDPGTLDAGGADTLDVYLQNAQVEQLASYLTTDSTMMADAIAKGAAGFADDDSTQAYTLAQALTNATGITYSAQLAEDQNRWYVRPI